MEDHWKSWFIEHKETHQWWAGQDENDKPVWTSDPMRSWPFAEKYEAEIRAFAHNLDQTTLATDHEFIDKEIN